MARRSELLTVHSLGEIRRNTPWLWLNCPLVDATGPSHLRR